MPKNVLKGMSVVLGVVFFCGCAVTGDIGVRRYVQVKDRVDQGMEAGNAGFFGGTPPPEDRSNIRKTRKTYVLEISRGVRQRKKKVVTEESVEDVSDIEESASMFEDFMEYEMEEGDFETLPSFVEYRVQKDDTLQKISKKFYDSYSKWPKIYEVNKGVIGNPDTIKPGIVIQIPTE